MRIHLGHHFYGAGNLGDDFMLAGFIAAMRTLAPSATYSCCVPFTLDPLRRRFPEITWHPYDGESRSRCIEECDVWLGLGGSPFQHALSRWFVDHLLGEADLCRRHHKPMFYLGVGVQTTAELASPEVRRLCAQAASIWTRDRHAADILREAGCECPVEAATDLAHVFLRDCPPPPANRGILCVVPNFDYGAWPGWSEYARAFAALQPERRIWLAQESRELPGAERALHAALPHNERNHWALIIPDQPGAPLPSVLERWPSGEWLVTARYHAALAGAWAGAKVMVLATNDKLRAVARELHAPLLSPSADAATILSTLQAATPAARPLASAERAYTACAEFVRSAVAHHR